MSTASPFSDDFDHLCLEDALISRLRDLVPELTSVMSEVSVDAAKTRTIATPAALVYWVGDAYERAEIGDVCQNVEQMWMVELVVRVAGDSTGKRAREKAGPLIAKTIKALRLWQPFPDYTELRLTDRCQPVLEAGGTLYVPLLFSTRFVL